MFNCYQLNPNQNVLKVSKVFDQHIRQHKNFNRHRLSVETTTNLNNDMMQNILLMSSKEISLVNHVF
jgi:hypothetical protein